MHHLRRKFLFPDRGLAVGFAWIGKGLFEAMDVSGNLSFFIFFLNPKWVPQDIEAALYTADWESCFVTARLIGSQRNEVIFCRRSHWHNSPFVDSLCVVCLKAEKIYRNMNITVWVGFRETFCSSSFYRFYYLLCSRGKNISRLISGVALTRKQNLHLIWVWIHIILDLTKRRFLQQTCALHL